MTFWMFLTEVGSGRSGLMLFHLMRCAVLCCDHGDTALTHNPTHTQPHSRTHSQTSSLTSFLLIFLPSLIHFQPSILFPSFLPFFLYIFILFFLSSFLVFHLVLTQHNMGLIYSLPNWSVLSLCVQPPSSPIGPRPVLLPMSVSLVN